MKKIAVAKTEISSSFIQAMDEIGTTIPETSIIQRKNGDIVYNGQIYKQISIKNYWKDLSKDVIRTIKTYSQQFGQYDILYNFTTSEKGINAIRQIAKSIVTKQKEDKKTFFEKNNIVLSDKYVFKLSDQEYNDQMKQEDSQDTTQEQNNKKNQLTKSEQQSFDRLKDSIEITKQKIDNSLNNLKNKWDDAKWNELQPKIDNYITVLENRGNDLSQYTNKQPAKELIQETIKEIKQKIQNIKEFYSIDLDVSDLKPSAFTATDYSDATQKTDYCRSCINSKDELVVKCTEFNNLDPSQKISLVNICKRNSWNLKTI